MLKKKKKDNTLFVLIIIFIALNGCFFAVMPLYVWDLFINQFQFNPPGLMLSVIIYVYLMAAPYFIALVHCAKLARNVMNNEVFSQKSIRSLNSISICSLVECALSALGSVLYATFIGGKLALILVFLAVSCCAAVLLAAVFSKIVNNAIKIKEENELTI